MNSFNNNNKFKRSVQVKPSTEESAIFRSVSMSTPPQRFHVDSHKVLQKPYSAPAPPQDHTHSSSAWVWKMNNQLHPVPMYHPLERTAVTIENLTLDTVTARVSSFMKTQSITCSYHSDSGRVDCLTEGLLKFVVQLWQGGAGANNAIIMEVQRRQGCCIEMQGVRNKVIHAILSGESIQPNTKQPQTTCEFLQTLVQTTTAVSLPPPPPRKDCLSTALDCCRRFLESERLDEIRLGLESLCILTDPSKVIAKDADEASRIILSDASFQDLLEKFFFDVKLTHNKLIVDEDDDDILMDYGQGQFFGCLHLLAIKALSNALESVARNDHSSRIPIDLSNLFWQTVLQSLYYNLQKAPRRPLEACLSTRCLRLLQTSEPSTLNMAPSQHRLHKYLMNAHQYGREHSRSLEQETEQLMGRLGFVH
jgi:hypothetical protein